MEIENVKTGLNKIKEGISLLDRGPLEYYVTELVSAYGMLMSRYAPFKVGDRVKLTKAPPFEEGGYSGWEISRHFLVPGSAGTVATATCGTSGFRFGVVFDDESWIDNSGYSRPKGTVVKIEKRHRFQFGENWLAHENAEFKMDERGKATDQ